MDIYTINAKVYNPFDNAKFLSFDIRVLAKDENEAERIAYNEVADCIDVETLFSEAV